MATQDFKMELQFPVPPQTLYDQFATQEGVQHWWTTFCEMDPGFSSTKTRHGR
jgi:uncharacterized protein YndB with AHSA1/START domain